MVQGKGYRANTHVKRKGNRANTHVKRPQGNGYRAITHVERKGNRANTHVKRPQGKGYRCFVCLFRMLLGERLQHTRLSCLKGQPQIRGDQRQTELV